MCRYSSSSGVSPVEESSASASSGESTASPNRLEALFGMAK